MEPTVPRHRIVLLFAGIIVAFVLSGIGARWTVPAAHADDTYQQRQSDALLERLVRAQEDQTKAIQEIARHMRRQ